MADRIRIATYNAALSREVEGGLLSDLQQGGDRQIQAVIDVIGRNAPDILLLGEIDRDPGLAALRGFEAMLAAAGHGFPHLYMPRQNTGRPSGMDLAGGGRSDGPENALGFGHFPGQFSMALLSRHPIDHDGAREFTDILWQDLAKFAPLPRNADGTRFHGPRVLGVLPLSSKGHWDVPVLLPSGPLHILASHPCPPAFDGPEERNKARNAGEIALWRAYLDGQPLTDRNAICAPRGAEPFVLLGDLNSDPHAGDGRKGAIRSLLAHPALQDPLPQGPAHGVATADFGKTGKLRVDYVLPSARLQVVGAGVDWPLGGQDPSSVASDHRMVWVDIHTG